MGFVLDPGDPVFAAKVGVLHQPSLGSRQWLQRRGPGRPGSFRDPLDRWVDVDQRGPRGRVDVCCNVLYSLALSFKRSHDLKSTSNEYSIMIHYCCGCELSLEHIGTRQ